MRDPEFPFIPPDTNSTNSSSSSNVPRENPEFKYPGKTVRFLEEQRRFDSSSSVKSPSSRRTFELRRGFIKNLQPATLRAMPQSRCNFQFNPQEIRQSVSMREDIYNPILLSAEQLSQPIGGNVTFQFDLFFDRSLELASSLSPLPGREEDAPAAATAGPDKVGVYADLRVLYDVIGQGINADLLELQRENLKSAYRAKLTRDSAYSSPSDETEDDETQVDPASPSEFDSAEITGLLGDNIGNRAFLIPNPVRIVFSKILMVDGFVTGTNVDFLKFNTDMVPMQCRVSLSVYAMYIGFAKQKTFLTSTLDTARATIVAENKRDTAQLVAVDAAIAKLNPFKMAFEVTWEDGATDWDEGIQNGDLDRSYLYYYLMPNDVFNDELEATNTDSGNQPLDRVGYVGFPKIRPNSGSGVDDDPILLIFDDANFQPQPSISYTWNFKVYCKSNQNENNGVGWTLSEANTAMSNRTNSKVAAKYEVTETANSKEQWGAGTSTGRGGFSDGKRIRRRTYKNEELSNDGSYRLAFNGSRRQNIINSYYIIEYNFQLTATVGTVQKDYATQPFFRVVKGDEKFGIESNFNKAPSYTTTAYYSAQAG